MKRNGYRAEELISDSLVTRQRWVIPVWLTALGLFFKGVGRAVAWWARHSAVTFPLTALAVLYVVHGWRGVTVPLAIAGVLLAAWALAHKPSFLRWVVGPAFGQWRLLVCYRRLWRAGLAGCGLAAHDGHREYLPVIRSASSTRWADTLRVRLLYGQTPEQFAAAAERLRHVFGAYRCTVRELRPGWVVLRFFRRDPLAEALPAIAPKDAPDLATLELGRTEDGVPFLLRLLGTHVLVAGATDAGKSSVLWSLIRAVSPLVRSGAVQLWVLDPKGGMEMAFGRRLFARFEDTDFEAMADLLEQAADRMAERARRLKGRTRLHIPTPGEPLVIIIVDEVAALTAYCPDRKTKDRIKAALSLLLSQGRGPGYVVAAALQDPRKDVLPFRDLFPTRIALRVTEAEHVDMVLGDGARDRGALCDRIPRSLPGVGYVRLDSDPDPVRVRIAYVTDDDIAETCDRYGPPDLPVSDAGDTDMPDAA